MYINNLITGTMTLGSGGSTPSGHSDTRVTYTAASGHSDWSGEIEGKLTSSSIPNISDVETIDIGTSVTSIDSETFYGCSGLTSVTIGAGVTSIKDYAFGECSSLTNIVISNGVTEIATDAFYYCSGLTNVTIPNSVTSIGEGAFYGCSGLTSVVFQGKTLEQVQNIEDEFGEKYYPWRIDDTSIISVA